MIAGVTLGEVTHFRRPPPGRFVMADGLTNNKSEELLDRVRVKLADSRESTQTTYLLSFSSGIARRQSVLSLQFAKYASATGTLSSICERSRHQCCRCYRAWLVGLKSDQRYPSPSISFSEQAFLDHRKSRRWTEQEDHLPCRRCVRLSPAARERDSHPGARALKQN